MMDEQSTPEEKEEARTVALSYQEQAAKDCTICRHYFKHSSGEEGRHDRLCPYHPENYGELKDRIRCFSCGVDCSLSSHSALGATIWYSRGCYGSRLLDRTGEHNPGELRIEICDMCLLMNHQHVIDSGSGKWAPWEPHIPPEIKGDHIRIFQNEDRVWKGIRYFNNGGQSHNFGNTALAVLQKLTDVEKHLTKKGYPMGHESHDDDRNGDD